jgi:hypothetical protein
MLLAMITHKSADASNDSKTKAKKPRDSLVIKEPRENPNFICPLPLKI